MPVALGPRLVVGDGRTTSVALSPNGKVLLTGGARRLLRDPGTGRVSRALGAEDCLSQAVALSPDGQLAAANCTGSPDTVRVWDVASGKLVGRHAYPEYQFGLSLGPTGRLLSVSGGSVSAVFARGETPPTVLAQGEAAEVAPDGQTFVVVQGKELRIHEAATAAKRKTLTLGRISTGPNGLVYSADSRFLALKVDGTWRLVDLTNFSVVALATGGAEVLTLSAGARTLLTISENGPEGRVTLLERGSGAKPRSLSQPINAVNFDWRSAAWSADGRQLWLAPSMGGLSRVEVSTGRVHPVQLTVFGQNDGAVVAAGSQAFVNLDEGAVVGVDLRTGQMTGSFGKGDPAFPVGLGDGELLTLEAGRLLRWSVTGGAPRPLLEGVRIATPQGDGTVALTEDALYRFQDLSQAPQQWTLQEPAPYSWLSPSAGTGRLIAGYEGMTGSGTDLIDLDEGETFPLSEDGGPALLSPDGTRVAWLRSSGVQLTDLRSGQVLWTGKGQPMGGTFTPDGTRLVVSLFDGTLAVHDASSGRLLQTLPGHGSWVESFAFGADGQLVTLGVEGTLRVWDLVR
ncbi:hypothetical protein QOL99_04705 [Deinococcus sp. MIMF12]|uniref:WD40 repeat domain-containing protein n=1 Tax=Deinococcus rhizophilus TaxID=3049544 RepID=A0ABT7JEH2_9DEIO|nr:hypothetical protein [Deinococcus rhizophilus]MDL2343450.1 hypothetical protein [Deinococcus rhizophilus]